MLDKKLIQKTRGKALDSNIILFKNFRFTVLTPNLIRIEKDIFLDDATIVVFYRDLKKVDYSYKIDNDTIIIETNNIILTFNTNKPLEENYMVFKENINTIKFLNNDYNLLGTCRTLDTYADGGYVISPETKNFNIKTLPLEKGILSRNGVSVIDDSNSPILKSDGLVKERKESYDYYIFMYHNNYLDALNDYYKITGFTPLIPRYTLGNWWSRYHRYTDKEYLSLLDKFEDKDVPLSIATIDMDWHYTDLENEFHLSETPYTDPKIYGHQDGWTGYSFNKHLFKNYKEFFKNIKDRGLYITLNLHPFSGIRWFEDMYNKMALSLNMDPKEKRVIEFDMTSESYINSYFKYVMHPYEEDGVDFWWIDYQQDRHTKIKNLDPIWPLNHYHYLDKGLILSRYAELGSHRYPLGFSGDTKITFDFLKLMPYFTFTSSNVGFTWWSHDIGGHHAGYKDDDLYVRFIEFGVFSPINRIHSSWMDVMSKEPWLLKRESELIINDYLRFRHRLIPYIYNYSHLTHSEGIPLIKPLYYKEPEVEEAYLEESTYYFGELVVSPIVEKRSGSYSIKTLYLPSGKYYDYFKRRFYLGGRKITIYRDLSETPLFIPKDSILVLDNDYHNFDNIPNDLEVNIVSNKASLTLNETNKEKFITNFNVYSIKDITYISIKSDTNIKMNRSYSIEVRHLIDGNVNVTLDNKKIKFRKMNGDNLKIVVKDIDPSKKLVISINNKEKYSISEYLRAKSLEEISKYEYDNHLKQTFYETLRDIETIDEYRRVLKTLDCPKELKKILYEITYIK